MINIVSSREVPLLCPKARASSTQNMLVTIAHKTAITEASSHVSVAGGFISFSVYIAYGFHLLAGENPHFTYRKATRQSLLPRSRARMPHLAPISAKGEGMKLSPTLQESNRTYRTILHRKALPLWDRPRSNASSHRELVRNCLAPPACRRLHPCTDKRPSQQLSKHR